MTEQIKAMALAYTYARVSTKSQVEKDGLDRQSRNVSAWLKKHPEYTLADTIIDYGVSAFKGTNLEDEAGLGQFMTNVRKGDIPSGSALLIEAVDRITRIDPLSGLSIFTSICNAGIDIINITTNVTLTAEKLKTDMGTVFLLIAELFKGNADAKQRNERVLEAKEVYRNRMRQDKKPGSAMCPGWLKLSADKQKFLVIPEKAAIIERIFNERIAGDSLALIAQRLNTEGVPVLHNRKRYEKDANGEIIKDVNGQPLREIPYSWTESAVHIVLKSKSVIGTLPAGVKDEETPDFYPRIVSDTIFNTVRQMSTRQSKKVRTFPMAANVLKGLLYCADCGMSFYANGITEAKPYFRGSLQCVGKRSAAKRLDGHGLCAMPTMNYGTVEDAVTQRLFAHLKQIDFDNSLQEELNRLDLEREKFKRLIATYAKSIDEEEIAGLDASDTRKKWIAARVKVQDITKVMELKHVAYQSTKKDTLDGLDLVGSYQDRLQANTIIKKLVHKMVIDTRTKTATVYLNNGDKIAPFALEGERDHSGLVERIATGTADHLSKEDRVILGIDGLPIEYRIGE